MTFTQTNKKAYGSDKQRTMGMLEVQKSIVSNIYKQIFYPSVCLPSLYTYLKDY